MGMGGAHRELLTRYVECLRSALELAKEDTSNLPHAPRRAAEPAGDIGSSAQTPLATHPRVLGCIIEYFFECERLNRESEAAGDDSYIYPHVFVHEMLSGENDDFFDMLGELDYLPIGIDEDGQWV